ncbi:oocyte-secreted protein 2 [Carlito syrichta]|uniref:Oocyte-secreted protein 2 n=1 Tax=Carlito syrichta TaxID=1868482 RepID=A0A1U7USR7_CARSF|nr:oocyte-secreted protein 2 [Carlito syrichta]
MTLEVLILLVTLIWSDAVTIDVKISCSMDWVMLSVSSSAQDRNLYIFADELCLGTDCPATRIQADVYDFVYPLHHCGIRAMVVSEDTLLIETEIYFTPRNMNCDRQKFPLECSVSRKSVWLTPVSTDDEIKFDPSPFIADFETTSEELGLLTCNQTGSPLKDKWTLEVVLRTAVGLWLSPRGLRTPKSQPALHTEPCCCHHWGIAADWTATAVQTPPPQPLQPPQLPPVAHRTTWAGGDSRFQSLKPLQGRSAGIAATSPATRHPAHCESPACALRQASISSSWVPVRPHPL